MSKILIGPATSLAIESLDNQINKNLKGIDEILGSITSNAQTLDPEMNVQVNQLHSNNKDLINRKNQLLIEQNSLISDISYYLAKNNNIVNGNQCENCCPILGKCTCPPDSEERVTLLLSYEKTTVDHVNANGHTVQMRSIHDFFPQNFGFCNQYTSTNQKINVYDWAQYYSGNGTESLLASEPRAIVLNGKEYPLIQI